ncbi:HNH endonuclease signature motif containing protein [uncultured Nocardioides sp.]|uniref:HNH endonuclease signature motif containing protein n=1 Tax=uncultured Nocardioides sp. TaxID=198441 RepID=UPI00262B7F45|nr:HNH endonuclease signature motif containing protein [uncultured Nocardioides sp.]
MSATRRSESRAVGLRPSTELTETQVLERVGECATTWMRTGAELLALAYEWAVAHPADRLDPLESGKPGRERATLYGGPGTPEVTEFAAAELGARMGRGTHAGRRHIAAALDLRLRLPLLWSRVQALEVRDTYAIHVAEATRTLSAAEAAWVDGEVAESADGRIPWTRFQTLVAGKVAAAAPAAAKERERRQAGARFAKVLKPLPGDQPAGMATFMVRAPLPVIAALDSAVTTLATRLADTLPASVTEDPDRSDAPTQDDLRVHAIALLAGGHAALHDSADDTSSSCLDLDSVDLRDLLPMTTLVVHLYGGTLHTDQVSGDSIVVRGGRDADENGDPLDRIARIDGHGPVTETWLRDVLGRSARFEVRPVLDIDGLAPVDAYEIPARHRRAVELRHPVETFPWGHAASTRSHTQVDHVIPWSRGPGGGRTAVGNLTPLATPHHRLKTHGGWQVAQPFPGVTLWRDPHGQTYLVDPTGTRTLDTTVGTHDPDRTPRPVVVELYRTGHRLLLADDFAA